MKPLKVALICKNENSKRRDNRSTGYWSYAVPEFTWEHIVPGKNFSIDCRDLDLKEFDLVFHEDYPYGDYYNQSIPIVFLSIDSTLSKQHFDDRHSQARKSDLVLVDHDDLSRYSDLKRPVYQFPYCVNDKIFFRYAWENETTRSTDIAYHCSTSNHAGNEERKRIRRLLGDLSVKHNWVYRSGVLSIEDYAESFRTAKIVVNQSRTPTNRPHRIFDAMACGAMVLTSPLPYIKDDKLDSFKDFADFEIDKELEDMLSHFLDGNNKGLEAISNFGYHTVMQNHTWSIRAKQLREIINKEFGI